MGVCSEIRGDHISQHFAFVIVAVVHSKTHSVCLLHIYHQEVLKMRFVWKMVDFSFRTAVGFQPYTLSIITV